MVDYTALALQRAFEGFLSKIQTGGGTAKLQVVDTNASPDAVILEFDLPSPELIFPSPFTNYVTTPFPLKGTCTQTANVRFCSLYLRGRDGTLLYLDPIDCGVIEATAVVKATGGMYVFESGYTYEISDIAFEMGTTT